MGVKEATELHNILLRKWLQKAMPCLQFAKDKLSDRGVTEFDWLLVNLDEKNDEISRSNGNEIITGDDQT